MSAVLNAPGGLDDTQQQELGVFIRRELMELVDDVIFANTFFALEETGLAYPSISKDSGGEIDRLDAWLRVFASANQNLQTIQPINNQTRRARSILSWALPPTSCNYQPIWGNALNYRIRLDQ